MFLNNNNLGNISAHILDIMIYFLFSIYTRPKDFNRPAVVKWLSICYALFRESVENPSFTIIKKKNEIQILYLITPLETFV